MTPKDFFVLIFKLFGIFSLFVIVGPVTYYLISFWKYGLGSEWSIFLPLFFLYLVLLWIFIYKPQVIITIFRLDKGFEQSQFNIATIPSKRIIEMSLVLIGCFLIIFSLTTLIQESVLWFTTQAGGGEYGTYQDSYAIYYQLIRLIIGTLVIALRKPLTRLFN